MKSFGEIEKISNQNDIVIQFLITRCERNCHWRYYECKCKVRLVYLQVLVQQYHVIEWSCYIEFSSSYIYFKQSWHVRTHII